MNAILYENIIRFANDDCGRYGTAGANADIYRNLTMSDAILREATSQSQNNNLINLSLQFGIALGEVSAYLADASDRIRRFYADELTENQRAILSSAILVTPTLEAIDQAIEGISDIIEMLRNN